MPASLLLAVSPEDEPIGRRTRTRQPLNDVDMDEIDALLMDEGDELFDEEGEDYRQFLRVCAATVHGCMPYVLPCASEAPS